MPIFKLMAYVILGVGLSSSWSFAATTNCIDNVCIGDDIETLSVTWKNVPLNYSDERFVEQELDGQDIMEVFLDYNAQLVADRAVLAEILPYVIRKQQFDNNVLLELSKVRAICSSLTMTGEVESGAKARLFVTFRVAADQGRRGKLRVVSIEKLYNIVPAFIRPADEDKYEKLKKELIQKFPNLAVVRDIDGREISSSADNATAILGFRFVSSMTNPLVLKLIDDENMSMIEDDVNASPLCKKS